MILIDILLRYVSNLITKSRVCVFEENQIAYVKLDYVIKNDQVYVDEMIQRNFKESLEPTR